MYSIRWIARIRLAILAAICAAATHGWAQNASETSHAATSSSVSGTVPSANAPTESATSQFVLGPADIIHINVWKNAELSQTVTVGPDGFVSLPLLGDVHAAGMTANQLGHTLTARLNVFIVNPQVTVSVVDIRSRQVYVLGQVAKPGGYPLVAPINVLQLIAQAGGLTTYANHKGITILRSRDIGVQQINFNYNNAVRGDAKQNISLQPGDTVVVP